MPHCIFERAMWEVIVALAVIYIIINYYRRRQMLENYGGRHVMITGCDTGFGNMLAKRLDSMGFSVFAGCLTEKGEDDIRKTCSNRVKVITLDVTNTESIEKACTVVRSALPANTGLWGLVNNAGVVGGVGHPEWLTLDDYKFAMDVNCYGIVEMCRLFLPIVRQERGRIVCITSMMGRIAAAGAPYVASKFAAEGYCDTLRRSVRKSGVTVHILEPGFFATNMTSVDKVRGLHHSFYNATEDIRKYYGEEYKNKLMEGGEKLLKNVSTATHKVVDAYVHALCSKYPKYRYVVGIDANTIYRFLWTVPEWISDFIMTLPQPYPAGELLNK